MILLLMRHGIAEDIGDCSDVDDAERALTDKGRRQARRLARLLKGLKYRPTHYLASGRRRAVETAGEVRWVFRSQKEVLQVDAMDMAGDWPQLAAVIGSLPKIKPDSVVLAVGHAPVISELLMGAMDDLPSVIDFRKGAVAGLRWKGLIGEEPAELDFYLAPPVGRRFDRG